MYVQFRFVLGISLLGLSISFHSFTLQAQQPIEVTGGVNRVYNGSDNPWIIGSDLRVGLGSTGSIQINPNAEIRSTDGYVGLDAMGTAVVSGAGASWNNSGALSVGGYVSGSLQINSGGQVSSTSGHVGILPGGHGTVIVDGLNSRWNMSSTLHIGESTGTGTVEVKNGAIVTSYGGNIAGSNGRMTIDGAGSMWDGTAFVSSTLNIGAGGKGRLDIKNAGTAAADRFIVGAVANTSGGVSGTGGIYLQGEGSVLTAKDFLTVQTNGAILVSDGATVNSTSVFSYTRDLPGRLSGAHFEIYGANTTWTNTGNFILGGTRLTGDAPLGNSSIVLETTYFNLSTGATLDIEGTLKVWDNVVGGVSGGAILNANILDISKATGFLVDDTSQLNVNQLIGDFDMTSGMLSADLLQGNLSQSGGVLTPGNSPGLTTIEGDYSFTGGDMLLEISNLTAQTGYDVMNVTGIASLGGNIDVNFLDGFVAAEGDTFNFVNAGSYIDMGTLTFDFSDATLNAGLVWDVRAFGSTGVLSVTAVPEPSAIIICAIGSTYFAVRRRRKLKT